MIPDQAIEQRQNREAEDQLRRLSGMSNKTRSEYAKAIENKNWEKAHKILCKVVFGFDYGQGDL
jgi:hypothetical protein